MIISVIIPVYKAENFIRSCLESVIEQESNAFKIECIIVDDNTPDKSMEIAKEVIGNYRGSNISFVFLKHDVNKGASAARNTGLSAASGDFLFFVDSDDVISENTLNSLFLYYVDYPYVDVVMGNTLWQEEYFLSNTPITGNGDTPYILDDIALIWESVLRRKIDRQVVNKLMRRSVIIDNKLFFDEDVALYEDVIWTYQLYSHISSILIVPVVTYMYESNSASLMHTSGQQWARKLVDSLTIVSDFVFRNPPMIDGKSIHYAAHRLFVSRWLMMAIDAKERYHIKSDLNRRLFSVRNALLWDAIKHIRPFMALFFLLMYVPFKYFMRFNWFRSKLYLLEQIVYKIS